MKIIFTTNIDAYKNKSCFPSHLEFVPRIGEKVSTILDWTDIFKKKKLPTRLEVVDVTHTLTGVIVELWYNKQDLEIATLAGGKPL